MEPNDILHKIIKLCLASYWCFSLMEMTCEGVGVSVSSMAHEKYWGPSSNVSTTLDSLLDGYDKRLRPNYKVDGGAKGKGPPVNVGISMHVYSISAISEVNMDFTIDMFFRQHWQDARLAFNHSHINFDEKEELCLTQDMLDKIWWPDTYFANGKNAKFHYATTKNAFFRINPAGNITQSLRLSVTAACGMDLTYFPMDSQVCKLGVESYGYSTRDIDMIWQNGGKDSVALETDVPLPQFQVLGIRTTTQLFRTSTGHYTRLYVEFLFARSLGYYVIQIYVPCILVVVLSWVSFWLSREAVPARVALGITTVLTMTTLISSTNASLPKISYLKSIDIFLIFSFFMVFMSLMEYAAVSYMENKYKNMEKKKAREREEAKRQATQPGSPCLNGETYVSRKQSQKLATYEHSPVQTEVRLHSPLIQRKDNNEGGVCHQIGSNYVSVAPCRPRLSLDETSNKTEKRWNLCTAISKPGAVDRYSRFLFPLTYSVFNVLYWVIYLNVSKTDYKDFV